MFPRVKFQIVDFLDLNKHATEHTEHGSDLELGVSEPQNEPHRLAHIWPGGRCHGS